MSHSDKTPKPALVTVRCVIDGCDAEVKGRTGKQIEKALHAHRLSCHPGWRKPPPANRLLKLPEWP